MRYRAFFLGLKDSYFFCVFTVLPEGLSLISVSFSFSLALVAGSVCLGVFTLVAMLVGLGKLNGCP